MKKISSILGCSIILAMSGGFNTLSSCSNNVKHYEKTPQIREKRAMNPNVANIVVGDFRMQILDKSTIRFEYKYNNPKTHIYDFLDDDTLFIPERTLYPGVKQEDYEVKRDSNFVTVTMNDIVIKIPTNINQDMKGIVVTLGGKVVYESSKDKMTDNTGDLPAPSETPECFELIDFPRIIEPIYGYSTYNLMDPYYKIFADTCGFDIQQQKDIYLTFPRKDAKALRQQYRNLAGAPEMVRLQTLGSWDSRYYPYNEQTAQEEVDHYYENNLPLDNLIIDTDWRAGFDGKGYFVNEALFPNMPRFLQSIHNQNIEVCFNDHPEPQKDSAGDELDVLNATEVDFRNTNLRKILGMGLNTWWYDRNWSTALICPGGKTDEHESWLNHETWGDYLYNNVTKQHNIITATAKYDKYGSLVYKRPTAMSNVVQVRNGKWEGFTDSMAHRYSIQWTGDQTPDMLPSEVVNVIKTGLNSMPYMSSDLAGHTDGVADDYYYQRWMEYGALSPIFRIHCTRDLEQHCQPWYRPEAVLNTFRDWINLRYRLLPLYYSLSKQAYDTGLPICRAMGLVDTSSSDLENQYCIGDNILFAPCTDKPWITTEDDGWVTWEKIGSQENEKIKVELFNSETPSGSVTKTNWEVNFSSLKDMRQYGRSNNVGQDGQHFSARITAKFKLQPGYDNWYAWVNSDDGVRIKIKDKDGKIFSRGEDWSGHSAKFTKTDKPLKENEEYTLELEYFNGSDDGVLQFIGAEVKEIETEDKTVYLPDGQWMDVFTGNVYPGKTTQTITNIPANQNALFVKLGTMLPLINNAQNTKSLDWSNLAYDVYPSKDSQPYTSYLYEDDFETVAYQNGFYHESPYSCYYDTTTNEFVIKLDPSTGWFVGDDLIANRTFNVRLHKVDQLNFGEITLDGKTVQGTLLNKDETVTMPFNFNGSSRTEDVISITIPKDSIRIGHEIRIQLN